MVAKVEFDDRTVHFKASPTVLSTNTLGICAGVVAGTGPRRAPQRFDGVLIHSIAVYQISGRGGHP